MEIRRRSSIALLKERFRSFPAVAIIGPRQCGKTTLARQFAEEWNATVHRFDLENPEHVARLDHPIVALEDLRGLVVIDEVQRRPDLFPALRVLIDRKKKVRFLILGSASRDLLAQGSETLAGRISYVELTGFTVDLVSPEKQKQLWLRGGFPPSYLARNNAASLQWRREFVSTLLERDIPALGFRIPPRTLRRFWTMMAHYHGQYFNATEIGRSLGMSDTAIRHHLDVLSGTFMVRQLQPFLTNTKKRLIRKPKVYFRDSGLLHALLALESTDDLLNHPKLGASWEGFAIEQVIHHLALPEEEVFFWGMHSGAELDLVFRRHGRLYGAEVKHTGTPKFTPSMRSAIRELGLAKAWTIHAGAETFPMSGSVTALCLRDLQSLQV